MPKITLEAARVNAGMSQADAAKAIGVSRATISNWEKGKTSPTGKKQSVISEAYNIPIDYIDFTTFF